MKLKLLLLSLVVMSIVSSCVTPRDTNFLQKSIKKNYPMDESLQADYKIIAGDQLVLKIYTLDPEMVKLFAPYIITTNTGITTATISENDPSVLNVYSDGTVKIPYVGKVSVLGLTVGDVKKIISARLQAFSSNLTIEIDIQNRFFTILSNSGGARIAMPKMRINIMQALALGMNFDTFSDRTRVRLLRQTPDGTEMKIFDIRSIDIIDSEFYYIQPNDVIYTQEMSRTFFGKVTSFSGMFGLFGIVTSIIAVASLIIRSTK